MLPAVLRAPIKVVQGGGCHAGKDDFRNKTISTVVRPKDFNFDKVSKVVVREHFHPLPTCSAGAHNSKCSTSGREIGCVRVIVGYENPTEVEPLGEVISLARLRRIRFDAKLRLARVGSSRASCAPYGRFSFAPVLAPAAARD